MSRTLRDARQRSTREDDPMVGAAEAEDLPPWRDVWRALVPFARRHRRAHVIGWGLTILGVAAQLALPWPLKQLLADWSGTAEAAGWRTAVPDMVPVGALLVATFLMLMFVAGFLDHAQRLWFTRFAIGWSRDVRAAATEAALQLPRRDRTTASGDLVARLISDVARFKAGVKIFLIYVATNLCLLLGATVLVWILSPELGSIFGGATLLACLIALWGSRRTRRLYREYRRHEGLLATGLEEVPDDEDEELEELGRGSKRHEADEMRQQGAATWAAHGLMGLAIVLGVAVGGQQVAAGRMEPGTLMVFLAYAFLLAKPLVRLTRQATRTGRLLACGERLARLLTAAGEARRQAAPMPNLEGEVRVAGAATPAEDGNLRIARGERLGLLGVPGAGEEAWLDAASTGTDARRERLLWDGCPLTDFADEDVAVRIGSLSAEPTWEARPLREVLGLESDDAVLGLLGDLGLSTFVSSLDDGLDTDVGSDQMALGEARLLWLARLLLGPADMLLLHDPAAGLSRTHAARVMKAIAQRTRGRTLVCSSAERAHLGWCDRLLAVGGELPS
ncbi:MAG: ABC transporter transmembrane domain-containing protein [Planctomycetota bacterium]